MRWLVHGPSRVMLDAGPVRRNVGFAIDATGGFSVADAPMACVALGCGRALENIDLLKRTEFAS